MDQSFYLKSLMLKNYRSFETIDLSFKPGINIVLGNNGSGKTSVLSGVAIALGTWFLGLPNVDSRGIQNEELRLIRQKKGDLSVFEMAGECVVSAVAKVGSYEDINWIRTRHTGKTSFKGAKDFIALAEQAHCNIIQERDISLPVIAYYGTGRLWGERRLGVVKKQHVDEQKHKESRYLGYLSALDPASNEKLLKRWIKKMAEASFHQGQPLDSLLALYAVITQCVDNAKRTYWDPREEDIVIEFDSGEQLPMYLMSDGQRNICAMVGDIAMRCIQLNPHLKGLAPSQSSGVILIDEVDQHLHPKWQRKVLTTLQSCFANIQFIVSTHSPFIVQSLQYQQLIILDDDGAHTRSIEQAISLEDTAEQIMEVDNPTRSESFNNTVELGKKIFALQSDIQKTLEDTPQYDLLVNQLKDARHQLARQSAMYSDNPLVTAYLKGEL